jgi:addiction module RelE/StbE family toxin
LEAIGEYFDRTSPQYASAIIERLYTSVEPLTEHPKMGRQGPEVEHETLRELIVENYRVIYQLREGQIEIITVVHSRRDLPKKFRRRGE